MLVLVADDEPETCALVSAILRSAGHQAVFAQDAMQVIASARQNPPDVIILDLRMPAGTGIGALQNLKRSAHTAHIPVVVLSGVEDEETIEEARRLGIVEYLSKPVESAALLTALERAGGVQ